MAAEAELARSAGMVDLMTRTVSLLSQGMAPTPGAAGGMAVPLAGAGAGAVTREYTVKTSRPLPDSGKREY